MAEAPRLALFRVRDLVTGAGSPFSPIERLVAFCVADHMNGAGTAWPSRRAIAAWTGLGPTAVRAALTELCGDGPKGLFVVTPGGATDGDRYRSNVYRIREEGAATRPAKTIEGTATRGARETRGSSGEGEGAATRHLGGRHAYTEGPIEGPMEGPNVTDPESTSLRDPLNAMVERLNAATNLHVVAARKVR